MTPESKVIQNNQQDASILQGSDIALRDSSLLSSTTTLHPFQLSGKRIYIGFGVAGRKGVSVAVPVDILSLLIVAEEARRAGMATGITILIADTHALRTGHYPPEIVARAAKHRKIIIYRACDALGVLDPQAFRASEIEQDELYQSLIEEASLLAKDDGEYFLRESCDIEFFRRAGSVGAKVGWTLASSPKSVGRFDEQAFDKVYLEIFPGGNQMKFLYAVPGRTLDPTKPKAAPYLDFENSVRVMLTHGEDVRGKLAACHHESTKKAALAYYGAIISAWERLSGFEINGNTVVEKIEKLISNLTEGLEDFNGD
jgi:hypothetical protein